jgi:hypothetical protein
MREFGERRGVDRRTILIAALAATPVWGGAISRAATKVSQSAVHYQTAPKDGQDCVDCSHFLAPGACKLVDGHISPKGWCGLWVKKAA